MTPKLCSSSVFSRRRCWILGSWVVLLATFAFIALNFNFGWDSFAYRRAMVELHSGFSPYLLGAERVQSHHDWLNGLRIWSYVYPPVTLPLMRLLASLPIWLVASVYWSLYLGGFVLIVRFGYRFFLPQERIAGLLLAHFALLFPGLLYEDVMLSGNIIVLVMGAALFSAQRAWRTGRWRWFFLVVLLASFVKPPLLTLLAIPLLSARRKWLPVGITGLAGVLVFVAQRWLWPEQFRQYIALFDAVRNFGGLGYMGFSPMDMMRRVMMSLDCVHDGAVALFYLSYATAIVVSLFFCIRRCKARGVAFERWAPAMILGVFLLNPRLKPYDIATISILIFLLSWRLLRRLLKNRLWCAVVSLALLGGLNGFAVALNCCEPLETGILVTVFLLSLWGLVTEPGDGVPPLSEPRSV